MSTEYYHGTQSQPSVAHPSGGSFQRQAAHFQKFRAICDRERASSCIVYVPHPSSLQNKVLIGTVNAPWCEHCQSLVPQLEKAAASLEHDGWHAASVDCEAEELLCREYQIGIYPTVYAFSGSSSNFTVYNDFHNADAMELFARRWRRPLVSSLSSEHDVRDFRQADRITVIASIDDADLQSRTAFWNVAEVYHDEFSFACVSGFSAAAVLDEDIPEPSHCSLQGFRW